VLSHVHALVSESGCAGVIVKQATSKRWQAPFRSRELVVADEQEGLTAASLPGVDVGLDVVEQQCFRRVASAQSIQRDLAPTGLVFGALLAPN